MNAGVNIVVDLGKTLSKVSLWTRDGRMLDRQSRPGQPVVVDGLRRLDVAGIGDWLVTALAKYAGHPVERIVPVGHGAAVVGVHKGQVAFDPLDYEQAVPPEVVAAYRRERDAFCLTGSPALPDGLNMGSQLFWLDRIDPAALAGASLLPWPQFWAWFLCGHAVSEVTSLGCHSDLWCPGPGRFSPMAERLGWAARFPSMAHAGDVIGTLRPEIAGRTGLPAATRILAGLHDSNAALHAARGFAEIARGEATVLSTGTWFVAMRMPEKHAAPAGIPDGRDCLVNVDCDGAPVPSARFMGGREIEKVIGIDTRRVDIRSDQPALLAAVAELLASGAMLLPTLASGCGPFPSGQGRWIGEPADWHARRAAACLYAALVADASLDLIGASDKLLIEGRFAEAEVFVRALAALRPATQVFTANADNDVSFGALRLIDPLLRPQGELRPVTPLPGNLVAYRDRWRREIQASRDGQSA